MHDIRSRAWQRPVLIWCSTDILSLPRDTAIVSGIGLDHRNRHVMIRWWQWPPQLRRQSSISIVDILVDKASSLFVASSVERRSISCLRGSRPLVASHVVLRETLLSRLVLPVIISDPPSVIDNPGSKLTKH